jgi:hypothetical protein
LRNLARSVAALIVALFAAAATMAADRTNVVVTIEPADKGVTARFALSRPAPEFRLNYVDDGIRDRTWTFADAAFKRDGTLVSRSDGASFDSFTVDVEPLNEPTNATYPCLIRVGDKGFVFYAGYFVGIEEAFETTIDVAKAADRSVVGFPRDDHSWKVESAFHRNAAHRYIYIGPPDLVSETPYARFVTPHDQAPELIARIRENVDGSIAFYVRKLARPLPSKPLIVIAPNFDYQRPGLQGDTTMGPTVALRLFGDRWKTFDPKSDRFDHYIAHEAAHFWNSDTFHAAEGSPAWMWEGSAEVWALAARMAVMKRLTPAGRREHIEKALTTCAMTLFDGALSGHRSGATYACGEALYWIADLAEKKRSRGRGDIFSIWRRMFERADSNGGIYTFHDFLSLTATSEDTGKALAIFLSDTGAERWQTLPAALKPLGVKLGTEPPAADALRHIAMWHVLDMVCAPDQSRGMMRQTDSLKLDTGDHCGPLSGDPEVDSLNGHSLFTAMPAAYAAAQTACAARGDLIFTRTGKPDKIVAPCGITLSSAPPTFRVLATP